MSKRKRHKPEEIGIRCINGRLPGRAFRFMIPVRILRHHSTEEPVLAPNDERPDVSAALAASNSSDS